MNISINNTCFQGKREVVYAMSMAAKEACNTEVCRALAHGPRPLYNRISEAKISEALTNAYMTMATFDDSFYSTLKNCDDSFCENLKQALNPEKLQFCEINPLRLFKKSMIKCLSEQKKHVDTGILDEFFEKITEKTKYQI